MTPVCYFILSLLVAFAVVMTSIGGWLDYTGQDRIAKISKQHFWNDGLFLLGLAILFVHFCE